MKDGRAPADRPGLVCLVAESPPFALRPRTVALRTMNVALLLFASYADVLGGHRMTLELPAGASVRDLLDHVRTLPGADRLPPMPVVAVNQQYATAQHRLTTGDEVALIPPVAGG
jgi:molybdopterin converting factor subunit 1